MVSCAVAGLAPIVSLARLDLASTLRGGGHGMTGRRDGQSLRSGLIAGEIALTLVLLFSCGSLLRSLIAAQNVYPGFDARGVIAMDLQLPSFRYKARSDVEGFYSRLLSGIRKLPGVESAGAVNCPPSTGGCARGWCSIVGMPVPAPADVPLTLLTNVDAGYFRAVHMRLLAGREFTGTDRAGGPEVVVNERLARRWWPGNPQAAIGSLLKFGGPYAEGPTGQIIGVVGDVNQEALDAKPSAEIYVRGAQNSMVVMVRSSGDRASLVRTLRTAVEAVDRDLPVRSLAPLESRIRGTLERRRFTTILFEIFAALAVLLSAVGIYGALSFRVQCRRKEIALRIAVGGARRDIARWMGGHLIGVVSVGGAVGVAGCLGASKVLASLVFGVAPIDLISLAGACGALLALAGVAGSVPIMRAVRVDPVEELRG